MLEDDDEPSDLQVEVTDDDESEPLPAPQHEIFSYPADTTLRGYLDQWNDKQLHVPPFQRNFIWDQTRASKLVESFLLGLPVPPVFLFKPIGTKNYWIIDGQQRILSVVYFQRGLFGEDKFRLKGVDVRWAGKSFEDLEEPQRFALQTSVLRAVVIQQTNPKDSESIYHIFERLNTGGLRLNAMEVRQCVHQSPFLDALKELNGNGAWRELLGLPKPDKRVKDVELLLRVAALFRKYEDYEKPMKGFLNDCAKEMKASQPSPAIATLISELKTAIEAARAALGPRPFHLKGRLNYSALDATLVGIMRVHPADDLAQRYELLKEKPEFAKAVGFNTSDDAVVKERINLAIEVLGGK